MAVGAAAMSMAPNTMNAVTQRIAADTTAGVSGMSARGLIGQSNRLVGNGATSAMGPTMSAMALAYQGGYTANSSSSKNIMGQLAGISAITGMPNERAATAVAGANGMNFLRAGIRLRNPDGSQKAPSAMINDAYNFLYRGRKISSQEAMLAFRPGSRSYYSIQQMAGGDQNLMQVLQAGVLARAKSGAPLTSKTLKDSQKSLDLLGIEKDSSLRSMFKFNTSEAKVLEKTGKGLVSGYNAGLDTASGLNNAFASVADAAGGVTTALMGLKGFLQTFPSAGNVAGSVSGLASGVAGMGVNALMMGHVLKRSGIIGGKGVKAGGGGGVFGMGKLGIAGKGAMGKAGRLGLAAGVYAGGEFLQKFLNKQGKNLPSWARYAGNLAFDLGQGALTGAAAGGFTGAVAGTAAGGFGALTNPYQYGEGGEAGDSSSGPSTTAPASGHLMSPVPSGAIITSGYGPRKVSHNSKGMPSSSFHRGTDYGVRENTSLRAVDGGRVLRQGFDPKGYGTYLVLQHKNNKQSLYAHLNKVIAGPGTSINSGDVIALSGGRDGAPGAGNSNGPHLHFEYGSSVSPGKGQVDSSKLFTKEGWLSSLFNKVKSVLGMGPSPRGNKYGTDANINMSKRPTKDTINGLSSQSIASLIAGFTHGTEAVSWEQVSKHLTKGQINLLGAQDGGRVRNRDLMTRLYGKGFKGKGLDTAFAVAMAESGGRVNPPDGDVNLQTDKWGPSIGTFQIRSLKNWSNYDGKGSSDYYRNPVKLRDHNFNLEAAFHKSNKGTGWKGWSTFTHGDFVKFLADSSATRQALKIPSYDTGIDSVPKDQLAMVHKDEMILNAKTADRIRNGGSGSLGGATINVRMDVNIAQASPAEAEHMVRVFTQKLEDKLRLERIGMG
jgi:murein DD-endopeptidase MepM/ murein hydrolase activator NlpD